MAGRERDRELLLPVVAGEHAAAGDEDDSEPATPVVMAGGPPPPSASSARALHLHHHPTGIEVTQLLLTVPFVLVVVSSDAAPEHSGTWNTGILQEHALIHSQK